MQTIKEDNQITIMKNMYAQGMSLQQIANICECCPNTVKKKLLNNGVKMRTRAGFKKPWNEDYFETIDTEAKAYFLGFIMTDGNVSIRHCSSPAIRLQIQTSDNYILEKLKLEYGTDNKISICNRKTSMSELRVHSKKMAQDLEKYGVVPCKTGKEQFPINKIPKYLIRHFLRGFFDGDGWVTITTHGKSKPRLNVGFCGNVNVIPQIKDYLTKELGVYNLKPTFKERDNLSSIIYGSKNDVKKLYDYFYQDATIYLTRKKDKFDFYYANTELTEIDGNVTHRD